MKRFYLFVLILTLIFIGSACKKNEELEFNIVGPWNITMTFVENQQTITENYISEFMGTATEGTWVMDIDDFSSAIFGNYRVNGDLVEIQVTHANFEQGITGNFTGRFENENKISGTWTIYDNGSPTSGTWTATK